jgi:hypothetical protein
MVDWTKSNVEAVLFRLCHAAFCKTHFAPSDKEFDIFITHTTEARNSLRQSGAPRERWSSINCEDAAFRVELENDEEKLYNFDNVMDNVEGNGTGKSEETDGPWIWYRFAYNSNTWVQFIGSIKRAARRADLEVKRLRLSGVPFGIEDGGEVLSEADTMRLLCHAYFRKTWTGCTDEEFETFIKDTIEAYVCLDTIRKKHRNGALREWRSISCEDAHFLLQIETPDVEKHRNLVDAIEKEGFDHSGADGTGGHEGSWNWWSLFHYTPGKWNQFQKVVEEKVRIMPDIKVKRILLRCVKDTKLYQFPEDDQPSGSEDSEEQDDDHYSRASKLSDCISDDNYDYEVTDNRHICINFQHDCEYCFDEHFFDISKEQWMELQEDLNVTVDKLCLSREKSCKRRKRHNKVYLTFNGEPPITVADIAQIVLGANTKALYNHRYLEGAKVERTSSGRIKKDGKYDVLWVITGS